jgi:hypothetical protein
MKNGLWAARLQNRRMCLNSTLDVERWALSVERSLPLETACPHAAKSTDENENGLWVGRLQKSARTCRNSELARKETWAPRAFTALGVLFFQLKLGLAHVRSRLSLATRGQRGIYIWENPECSIKPRSFEN